MHIHRISTLLYSIAVGYSLLCYYNTDTECTRAIASTPIHTVVLCESAQRYRALMVILQSHGTQNMILRCYLNVSAILRRHIKSCLLCFFNNPYMSPFYLLVSALFLHALQYCIQAGALLRPKNGYLVRSRGVSSVRAHVWRRRGI